MENMPSQDSPIASATWTSGSAPPYYSINPALFDSKAHWSYQDLRRLCKRLNLPASGKREEIAARLQEWHRESRRVDQAGKFLGVEVRASGKEINPQLVSPLKPALRLECPSPSILSAGRRAAGEPPLRGAESRLVFSPFNQVKLIPSKEHSEMYGKYREPSWEDGEDSDDADDDSDLSDCENEVLRESLRRARQ